MLTGTASPGSTTGRRQRPVPVPPLPAVPGPPAPAPPDLLRPAAAQDKRGVQAGPPVHRGHLPARHGRLHGPRPQHRPVLRGRRLGHLPSFCIVDPDFRSFSEENPQDIRKGESFAAEVINRVMHGPAGPTRCSSGPTTRPAATTTTCRRPRRSRRTTCAAAALPPARACRAPCSSCCSPATCGTPRNSSRARTLRHLRVPGARGDRVTLRAAGLRALRRVRPHLDAQARRGEVEPARADQAGRGGGRAARCAGPDGAAGVHHAAGAAKARRWSGAAGRTSAALREVGR